MQLRPHNSYDLAARVNARASIWSRSSRDRRSSPGDFSGYLDQIHDLLTRVIVLRLEKVLQTLNSHPECGSLASLTKPSRSDSRSVLLPVLFQRVFSPIFWHPRFRHKRVPIVLPPTARCCRKTNIFVSYTIFFNGIQIEAKMSSRSRAAGCAMFSFLVI